MDWSSSLLSSFDDLDIEEMILDDDVDKPKVVAYHGGTLEWAEEKAPQLHGLPTMHSP